MVPTTPAAGLSALQAHVAQLLAEVRHPRVAASLALCEEAGELARLTMDAEVYGKRLDRSVLGHELADVVVCVCELASAYDVDLASAVGHRLAKLAEQAPRWAVELGPALAARRAAWDTPGEAP